MSFDFTSGSSTSYHPKNPDEGKTITQGYRSDGQLVAMELVDRTDSVNLAKNILNKKIDSLKNALLDVQNTPSEHQTPAMNQKVEELTRKIGIQKKLAQGTGNLDSGWISSSFFRKQLRQAKHKSIDCLKEAFKNTFVSALVNCRYHACTVKDAAAGFFRFGVITDHRNGFTNLGELKQMQSDPDLKQKKLNELKKQKQKLENSILKSHYTAEIISIAQAIDDIEHLDDSIEERRQVLSTQMLGLIVSQVEKNLTSAIKKEGCFNSTIFPLVHLGLLNPETKVMDKETGWYHHEANEMQDMHTIFEEFANKTLLFDGLGPYVDEEGVIHLPFSSLEEDGSIKAMTLNPQLVNISVQVHTKNDGIQKKT